MYIPQLSAGQRGNPARLQQYQAAALSNRNPELGIMGC